MSWKLCTAEMPDSDETVMIYHAASDETVWIGYHDGEQWRDVSGACCEVSHWMRMPEPPPINHQPSTINHPLK